MKMIRRRGGNIKVHQFNTDIRGNAAPVGQSVGRSAGRFLEVHRNTRKTSLFYKDQKKRLKSLYFSSLWPELCWFTAQFCGRSLEMSVCPNVSTRCFKPNTRGSGEQRSTPIKTSQLICKLKILNHWAAAH